MIEQVIPGIYRSPLPRARDIAEFAARGGATVVDLTQRERSTVARACERQGLRYIKHPLPYVGGDIDAAVEAILSAPAPVLFHCYHGRDRTGCVARVIRMRKVGRIILYRVGRNLNRVVRTTAAFGVPRLTLIACDDSKLGGNLYGAKGRVTIDHAAGLEVVEPRVTIALETGSTRRVETVAWDGVSTLLLGGETSGLPRTLNLSYATIGMAPTGVSGLTVEAALAVALHQWRIGSSG